MQQRSWTISVVLVLAGCAAETHSSQGSGNNHGVASSGGAGTAGSAGSSAAGSSGGAGTMANFGNGGGTGAAGTGMVVMPTVDGGVCPPGMFCKPTQPDGNCGTLTLKGDVKVIEKPGNVLLVWDRSGSMTMPWNGMPKWQAAGNAMISALTPIADKLTIGFVGFPGPRTMGTGTQCGTPECMFLSGTGPAPSGNWNCAVNPITTGDQINFEPGAKAMMDLKMSPNYTPMVPTQPRYQVATPWMTPTSQAIVEADKALTAATLTGTTAVVLVTDGEPNCGWNQAMTIATITAWAQKGIKTYVVGLPGAATGIGPMVLTALAGAGGTMSYITPTDAMALQMKLGQIVSTTVQKGLDSCTIHLSPVAMVPEKLQLVVTENGMEQSVPHMFMGQTTTAWTISQDGSTVDIMGQLCTDVKAGRFSEVRFTFGCKDIPVLPPPIPQ